jgi:hypothetical protein
LVYISYNNVNQSNATLFFHLVFEYVLRNAIGNPLRLALLFYIHGLIFQAQLPATGIRRLVMWFNHACQNAQIRDVSVDQKQSSAVYMTEKSQFRPVMPSFSCIRDTLQTFLPINTSISVVVSERCTNIFHAVPRSTPTGAKSG